MTNEEAIKILKSLPDKIIGIIMPMYEEYDYKLALDLAIKALEERPQGECKDCKYFFDTVGRCDNCNRNHWYSDNFIKKSI